MLVLLASHSLDQVNLIELYFDSKLRPICVLSLHLHVVLELINHLSTILYNPETNATQ